MTPDTELVPVAKRDLFQAAPYLLSAPEQSSQGHLDPTQSQAGLQGVAAETVAHVTQAASQDGPSTQGQAGAAGQQQAADVAQHPQQSRQKRTAVTALSDEKQERPGGVPADTQPKQDSKKRKHAHHSSGPSEQQQAAGSQTVAAALPEPVQAADAVAFEAAAQEQTATEQSQDSVANKKLSREQKRLAKQAASAAAAAASQHDTVGPDATIPGQQCCRLSTFFTLCNAVPSRHAAT